MGFKKKRGIKLSYRKQGLIYFTCLDYESQDRDTKAKIRRLCREIGGEDYFRALFAVLTTEQSVRRIAMERAVSETHLYRLRKQFYESW